LLLVAVLSCFSISIAAQFNTQLDTNRKRPPRVAAAHRLLGLSGSSSGSNAAETPTVRRVQMRASAADPIRVQTAASPAWQAIGPAAVETTDFGLVTGRVTSIALDPSDVTGNRLYLGTTGGGVWVAQNAGTSNTASIVFAALTDSPAALSGATDPSISIGALTVQPGGTGIILAGTGETNDVLDSYYGSGILRSTDNGNSWSLITRTSDVAQGLGVRDERFYGEGFAGFAWSTVNPQLVVAAVAQSYKGAIVNAVHAHASYQGLYYSTDSGATWHLGTISDGGSSHVQGPTDSLALPDGNAATSVVWNPVRKVFIATVRYHGYYQSTDGVTWTRMAAQPGTGLTTLLCPTNTGSTGSIACPIYRGTLAVNPLTGDTFAWTIDTFDQDQGLWQDQCAVAGGSCASQSITFAKRWSTSVLDADTSLGAATIADGSYTLALASVPTGSSAADDTILFAGADDLWKCSLAEGCVWRNTTNVNTCRSAHVAPYIHAIAWNAADSTEIFIGNDSGIWRSTDAVGQSGEACSSDDAQHFQNLNGSLGSLAELTSVAISPSSQTEILAGLGGNGTAGTLGDTVPANWPQVLTGLGGPVAIDPKDSSKWYVNTQPGVSIYHCANASGCTAADFGSRPAIGNTEVSGDGLTMPVPAPFIVDPLDTSYLLIGTCRVWRGSADGAGWASTNVVSPILDSKTAPGPCSGNALIRSMAAAALSNGTERVYVGTYGGATFGAKLAGHVLTAVIDPASSTQPVWNDVTLNPVTNDTFTLNQAGMDVSSIYIDPHDATGNTVYVTIEGFETASVPVQTIYRSVDGGAHWAQLTSNLPDAPANSVVVDAQNAGTVYLATDAGVYVTSDVADCGQSASNCWSVFGTGLPASPVVSLNISGASTSSPTLLAATYGRGLWQAPLVTAGPSLTAASADPASLTFAGQAVGAASTTQTVAIKNTGTVALVVASIEVKGDFEATDNCVGMAVAAGATCEMQVKFAPAATGSRTGQAVIAANIAGGQISVALSGTGLTAGTFVITPPYLDFGDVPVGSKSDVLPAQAENSGQTAVAIASVAVSGPFMLATNSCGTTSLSANSSCQMQIRFVPTQAGSATGELTVVDAAGTQTVALKGSGQEAATDTLSGDSLSFQSTPVGALSSTQTITLTNSGDMALTSISLTTSGPFQASHTCGTQLAGHASCVISVVFAPMQEGNLTGLLSVADLLRTQSISLSGTAVAPAAFSVSPASMTFSGQQAGIPSVPQTLTVHNTGGAQMANVGFQFTGPAATSYSIPGTTCGATLNAAASCTAQVVFTPAAPGSITASLIVSSSTQGVTPISVPLNGSGQVGEGVAASPSLVNFSSVGVGQVSSARTITISNSSGFTVSALALGIQTPFALGQTTCAGSLPAGTSCTAAITFQPTVAGAASGTLTIGSPDLTSPVNVALSGVGFDFDVAVVGNSSLTIASGQTANYTVAITPAAGAAGSFTYSCGSLPSNSMCSFNPATTTINSGAVGSITVSIATGRSSSARNQSPASWRTLSLLCGLIVVPLSMARRRRFLTCLAILLLAICGVTSCSGSGGGSSSSGGGGSGSGSATPAGTYKVPVTVTSSGISRAVSLTLTVD
jgi:BNR/Asp-box repeat.